MIRVSLRAKQQLKRCLLDKVARSGVSLRLEVGRVGVFGLVPDSARPDDQVVQYEGETVLLVDRELAERLDGWGIDYRGRDGESSLTVNRPREAA